VTRAKKKLVPIQVGKGKGGVGHQLMAIFINAYIFVSSSRRFEHCGSLLRIKTFDSGTMAFSATRKD
jgi:hypothetical protein